MAGDMRIPDYRCRPAAAWGSSTGPEPFERTLRAWQPHRSSVFDVLHLPIVSDHRPLLCHTTLCNYSLYSRFGKCAPGRARRKTCAFCIFLGIFCRCTLFLTASGQDTDVGWQGAQSMLSGIPKPACACGSH